jgi:hypothetical protein
MLILLATSSDTGVKRRGIVLSQFPQLTIQRGEINGFADQLAARTLDAVGTAVYNLTAGVQLLTERWAPQCGTSDTLTNIYEWNKAWGRTLTINNSAAEKKNAFAAPMRTSSAGFPAAAADRGSML